MPGSNHIYVGRDRKTMKYMRIPDPQNFLARLYCFCPDKDLSYCRKWILSITVLDKKMSIVPL